MLTANKGQYIVSVIRQVSFEGRACKQTPVLQALAVCARCNDLKTKAAAYEILPDVCRNPNHLFEFVSLCEHESAGTGWGRSHRVAIGKWYNQFKQNPLKLAHFVTKYKRSHGWSHKDIIRKAHIIPETCSIEYILAYAVKGFKHTDNLYEIYTNVESIQEIHEFLMAVESLKNWEKESIEKVYELITVHGLGLEHIPGKISDNKKIWDILLRQMSITAMIRNLGMMSSMMLLRVDSFGESLVLKALGNSDYLRTARVHPFTILTAWKHYKEGYDNVNENIANALELAFFNCLNVSKPTAKRFCLAVDVSVSMAIPFLDELYINGCDASVAMMLATAKTEEKCEVVAFSQTLTQIPLSRNEKLDDVIQTFRGILQKNFLQSTWCSSNCALPIQWACTHKKKFDVFVLYTNSETVHGNIHAVDALQRYRTFTRDPEVRLIVIGMANNGFSVADQKDPLMMDVVGFDTLALRDVANFVDGTETV